MTGDIRHVVASAVRLHGSKASGLFTTASFAAAIRAEFGTYETPGPEWCKDVLAQLPYVNGTSSGQLWTCQPEVLAEFGPVASRIDRVESYD